MKLMACFLSPLPPQESFLCPLFSPGEVGPGSQVLNNTDDKNTYSVHLPWQKTLTSPSYSILTTAGEAVITTLAEETGSERLSHTPKIAKPYEPSLT